MKFIIVLRNEIKKRTPGSVNSITVLGNEIKKITQANYGVNLIILLASEMENNNTGCHVYR